MTDLTVPPEAYEAAAQAEPMHSLLNKNYGFCILAGEHSCHELDAVRAAVDAVWPLAVAEGRRQIFAVLRDDALYQKWNQQCGVDPAGPRSYVPAEQRDVMRDFAEWAAGFAEGRTDE